MKELESLKLIREKMEGIDVIQMRLDGLDFKFAEQAARIEQVQTKVDLSVCSIGEIHQDNVQVARVLREATQQRDPTLDRMAGSGLHAPSPAAGGSARTAMVVNPRAPPPPPPPPPDRTQRRPVEGNPGTNNGPPPDDTGNNNPRRTWMPKMEFPRFNGEGARMWLDNCEAYFLMYNIPDNFKVMSASLHLLDNAAHWYQSIKFTDVVSDWSVFSTAVMTEFDVNVHRDCMRELLVLKQVGSIQEYRLAFNQLVYKVRLYEGHVSETLLVTRFILGLKEELRAAVEMQMPQTVQAATQYALVQEALLARSKAVTAKYNKSFATKGQAPRGDTSVKMPYTAGDIWKARQLKEYRRQNGECYGCGEKYIPGHVCASRQTAQVKAIETEVDGIILTDDILDAVAGEEAMEAAAAFLTANAMSGTTHAKSIKLRALVGNQVMLLLIDSGSSHTFIDQHLVDKLHCQTTPLSAPLKVKVANGQYMDCSSEVKDLEWWINGTTFQTDMKVVPLGGYDAILGMDWLARWGKMTCHWQERWIEFEYKGKTVTLTDMPDTPPTQIQEMSVEELEKSLKGNNVWATVVLTSSADSSTTVPDSVKQLIATYSDVFQDNGQLPPHRTFDHAISLLPDSAPVNSRPYRYSPQQKDEIERQVSEMMAASLVTPSMSPFASPVLLVKKKDGTWRFCVDYRRLNNISVKSKFPMPVVDELLDELAGTRWFSKLDLKAGYHQIRMVELDEPKTAFKTHHGQFQFRVMPFGLTNAPATFQCLMNSLFASCIRKYVLVFMDDILVYSKDLHSHIKHLDTVLGILRHNQLFAKLSKCSFAQQQLEYLGHIISVQGVATDPEKTAAMANWPQPTTVTELRGFLGLTGYYRKFVKNYGLIAKPLTNLLKKQSFQWSPAANVAFQELKQAMITTPVLTLPDFSKQFCIETDACANGIGAVLSQQGHPVAFYSKALGPTNQKLSIYEKEFMAIMMAVERWRSYISRGPFIIKTDHKSLCNLEDQVLTTDLQRKAMTKLVGLQFKFQYKKGADNKAADALSRVGHVFALQTVSTAQPVWLQEVLNSYAVDVAAQLLLQKLAVDPQAEPPYSLSNGLIKYKGKIWIGANAGLQTKLIEAFHSSPIGGHSGMQASYQRVKKLFHWTGIKQAVANFVQQCQTCQQAKHEHCKYPGLLSPLKVPEGAWEEVSLDFIEGLPKSNGFTVILVVVDRYTKYSHFIPVKHPYTAATIAELFLNNIVKLHSMPVTITSDRDPVFTSKFWTELFKLWGTKLQMSTAYHPQTDGQTERVNQCLEMYLRCAVQENPKQWSQCLPLAEFWYNTTHHTSLGCTPFKAIYGKYPHLGEFAATDPAAHTELQGWLKEREAQSAFLKQHLTRAQHKMKQDADRNRTAREFAVGDTVFLKLQPYTQSTIVNRPYPKLAMKFFGPFVILQRIGQAAYKLQLPANCQVHPVFHVSQLKEHVPDHTPVYTSLPEPLQLDVATLLPEEILERRLVKKGNAAMLQVRIRWTNSPAEVSTWEDYEALKQRFPDAPAWGQAGTEGEANVTTSAMKLGSAVPGKRKLKKKQSTGIKEMMQEEKCGPTNG